MQYQMTVMAGEAEHRRIGKQTITQVGMGLTLLGARGIEKAEHLGILLREGRTVYDNGHNMSVRVEEAGDEPDGTA